MSDANLVNLRAAVIARLDAATVVPAGAVLDARLAATPPELARSVTVSIGSDSGLIGPGANVACTGTFEVLLEIVARGKADAATMDACDSTYWACLTALLVDPTFRGDWPIVSYKSDLHFLPDAGKAVVIRMARITIEVPTEFAVEALDKFRTVAAEFDLDNPPDDVADVEATMPVGSDWPEE